MRTLADLVGLRTAACRDAVDAVAQIAAGEVDLDPTASAHVATCLRCQAEVAAYRRVLRVMRSMRDDLVPAPPEGLAEALRLAGSTSSEPSRAVRAAYVGGITAAGAAGVLVWFSRRRPGVLRAV